ncbi:MAG: hypothetical protein JWO56_1004 [Acidobacteria bacterium]|nr:hypothetical protein [Acidobacteriota bacterium]
MARVREEERESAVLERGTITFLYRPRVGETAPDQLDDIQRLLIVLAPEDGQSHRVIAIGRKRLPEKARRERFWGFVDLVLYDRRDLDAALESQMYKTRTRGIGHLPAARVAGTGSYELALHDGHSHLHYTLSHIENDDPVVREMALEPQASYIVTVANPDPTAWGFLEVPPLQHELFDLTEVHVTVPNEFPPKLQARFGGRRFAQLETTEFLDHPGAELVFIPV